MNRVFISHASEDNSFAIALATYLREHGIDPWIDLWELRPGDSLTQKIFDEGLSLADVVIVILSSISVEKPWVKKEIDTAYMLHIDQKVRIIPVVIDDCPIPTILLTHKYQRLHHQQAPEQDFRIIMEAIYGYPQKPPLGQTPPYVQAVPPQYTGLTPIDALVFQTICKYFLQQDHEIMHTAYLADVFRSLELSDEQILESLEILHNRHLIRFKAEYQYHGLITMTGTGLDQYGRRYIVQYAQLLRSVLCDALSHILGSDELEHKMIAQRLGQPIAYISLVLLVLQTKRYITLLQLMGNNTFITQVTSEGKRWAQMT